MSESPLALADPFASVVSSEEEELRALARALQLADGFKLFFVRCNQPPQRRRLVAALRDQVSRRRIQEIELQEPISHLLDVLRERVAEPPPDAVFVSGLEYSLPAAEAADKTRLVANLNAARDSFPAVVPCPLVLWAPEYVLAAIARGAPDFFSIRSGVYCFAAPPGETIGMARALMNDQDWAVATLPLRERRERAASLQNLLADYDALPSDQWDVDVEWRLRERLGDLLLSMASHAAAEEQFRRLLTLAQSAGDARRKARALHNLGSVYGSQGRWDAAIAAYQQSRDIYREFGDRLGEGRTLHNLGSVYASQDRWDEAIAAYQQSRDIYREFGDRLGEGRTLHNLGSVYASQGRWDEAIAAYQRSLEIQRDLGDRQGEGMTLNNLGNVYRAQGHWDEAIAAYQQNLAICRQLGDRLGEGRTAENVALLWEARGDLDRALPFARQAVAALEGAEATPLWERARETLARLEAAQRERQQR